MEFQVPQFIEAEAKIAGPLTFRQFLFIGGTGLLLFFLYFLIGQDNLLAFIFIAAILSGGTLVFAFVKIGGRPSLIVVLNFFIFFFTPKIYLWRKKTIPPKIIRRIEKPKEKEIPEEEGPTLKIAEKSQLKKLSTLIETHR